MTDGKADDANTPPEFSTTETPENLWVPIADYLNRMVPEEGSAGDFKRARILVGLAAAFTARIPPEEGRNLLVNRVSEGFRDSVSFAAASYTRPAGEVAIPPRVALMRGTLLGGTEGALFHRLVTLAGDENSARHFSGLASKVEDRVRRDISKFLNGISDDFLLPDMACRMLGAAIGLGILANYAVDPETKMDVQEILDTYLPAFEEVLQQEADLVRGQLKERGLVSLSDAEPAGSA